MTVVSMLDGATVLLPFIIGCLVAIILAWIFLSRPY